MAAAAAAARRRPTSPCRLRAECCWACGAARPQRKSRGPPGRSQLGTLAARCRFRGRFSWRGTRRDEQKQLEMPKSQKKSPTTGCRSNTQMLKSTQRSRKLSTQPDIDGWELCRRHSVRGGRSAAAFRQFRRASVTSSRCAWMHSKLLTPASDGCISECLTCLLLLKEPIGSMRRRPEPPPAAVCADVADDKSVSISPAVPTIHRI